MELGRIPYPEGADVAAYDKRANIKVKVHAERVWYDDGYRTAKKGEIIVVDSDDAHMLIEVGQVARLGQDPKTAPPKPEPKSLTVNDPE